MNQIAETRIILASASPRRRELLASAGAQFEVVMPDIEEKALEGEKPEVYVKRNARLKAQWVYERHASDQQTIVIAGDTIVVCDGLILEKPRDHAHARSMLSSLSGKTHKVLSGVSIVGGVPSLGMRQEESFVVQTQVTFKKLTDGEIDAYLATNEPFDKAGGYGAQGFGAFLVHEINGSFTNVVGLPLSHVVDVLRLRFGWKPGV